MIDSNCWFKINNCSCLVLLILQFNTINCGCTNFQKNHWLDFMNMLSESTKGESTMWHRFYDVLGLFILGKTRCGDNYSYRHYENTNVSMYWHVTRACLTQVFVYMCLLVSTQKQTYYVILNCILRHFAAIHWEYHTGPGSVTSVSKLPIWQSVCSQRSHVWGHAPKKLSLLSQFMTPICPLFTRPRGLYK